MSVAGWNIDKLIEDKFYNLSSGSWNGQSLSLYAGIIDNTLKVTNISATGGIVTHVTLQYTKTTD